MNILGPLRAWFRKLGNPGPPHCDVCGVVTYDLFADPPLGPFWCRACVRKVYPNHPRLK